MSIWNGFDDADIEIHMDEIAADRREYEREMQAELDAEQKQQAGMGKTIEQYRDEYLTALGAVESSRQTLAAHDEECEAAEGGEAYHRLFSYQVHHIGIAEAAIEASRKLFNATNTLGVHA